MQMVVQVVWVTHATLRLAALLWKICGTAGCRSWPRLTLKTRIGCRSSGWLRLSKWLQVIIRLPLLSNLLLANTRSKLLLWKSAGIQEVREPSKVCRRVLRVRLLCLTDCTPSIIAYSSTRIPSLSGRPPETAQSSWARCVV